MRRVGTILFLAAPPFLLLIACILNAWAGRRWFDPLLWAPLAFACAAVGSLLWLRRAGGAIAGLFIYIGIGLPIGMLVQAYAQAGIEHGLAGASWAAVLFQASLALTLGFYLILQLFPTGVPLSPRWRILVWLTVAAGAIIFLTSALGVTSEFRNNFPTIEHPLHILPAGLTNVLDDVGGMATLVLFVASAAEIVLRYRRSTGDQRAQMKWFAAAAAIAAGGFLLGFVLRPDDPAPAFALLSPLIPVAAGIAILKFRLYDIDVVISKTVVIALLAVFIAAVYVAIVVGIGTLAGTTTSPALSIAASVLVAVLFQTVRVRARRLANRLVYGERATPYEVIAGFSERVADAVSTDRVLPQMAEAAGRGVGAVDATVLVRLPGGLERTERWSRPGVDPDRVAEPWTVTVGYQGEPVGDLIVTKPANDPLTPAEQNLLGDLAAQAGLALHNVRLTEELEIRLRELDEQAAALRVSRERLVTARDAQRRGLQRDIHEGPERQLLDIRQRLHGAHEPEELDELIVHANDTLDGLRDLARGIFPPLLAEQGIVAALRAHIRKVGANATVEAAVGFADRRFDADTEAGVYFCCLQAIQNVIRHADNAPCVVALSSDADAIAFEIRDDGPGFDAAATARGMGLQIVQDRVDALDGTLGVTSDLGHGTRVAVRVPIRALESVR
jgi:signal transduction histidine kinase